MNLKPANLQRVLGAAPLALAAQQGDVAALGRLLDGGADPNALAQTGADDRKGHSRMRVAAVASREPWLVDEVDMYRFACSRWFD